MLLVINLPNEFAFHKTLRCIVCHTIHGSEIPNNHLGCIKPVVCYGINYHINWFAGFLPSTVGVIEEAPQFIELQSMMQGGPKKQL